MDNTYITQNAEILAKIATIGSFVVAVSALIFSYLQSRFRKHEIKELIIVRYWNGIQKPFQFYQI